MRLSFPSGGCVSPCGIARQVLQKVVAAGLELVTDQAKAEHPAAEGIFFIVCFRFPCRGFLLGQRLMGHGKAELDVGFDFAGVEGAVEKAELDGPLGEGGVEVQAVVAATVVMHVPSVGGFHVPEICEFRHRRRPFLVEFLEELCVGLAAVAVFPARVDAQCAVDQVFLAVKDVHQIPQGLRCEPFRSHMDVDAAGAVGEGTGSAQGADEFLQARDVVVRKDGADHFGAVVRRCFNSASTDLLFGIQAGIVHGFPFPSLSVFCDVGVVGAAFVVFAFRPEEGGHQAGRLAAGDSCHFDFDAKVLCFHNYLCPFYVCVCSFGTLYITLKAHNSKSF